jgi:hypothetical protein
MARHVSRAIRIAGAIAGAALAAVAITVAVIIHSGSAHDWIAARIAAALGPRVRFATVELGWWPPPLSVTLIDVQFADTPDVPAAATGPSPPAMPPPTSVRRIVVRLELRELLAGRVAISGLEIDGLTASVVRAADGTVHVSGLTALPDRATTPGGAVSLPAPVTLRDGRLAVRLADVDPPLTLMLSGVDVALEPEPPGLTFTVSAQTSDGAALHATGQIGALSPPWTSVAAQATVEIDHLDTARLAAQLRPDDPALRLDGDARVKMTVRNGATGLSIDAVLELGEGLVAATDVEISAPFRVSGTGTWSPDTGWALTSGLATAARLTRGALSADGPRATFEYRAGALALSGLTARAYGATWQQTGRVTFANRVAVDVALRADGVDMQQLADALRGQGITLPPVGRTAPVGLTASIAGTIGGDLKGHAGVTLALGTIEWAGVRLDAPLRAEADLAVAGSAVRLSNGQASARALGIAGLEADAVDLRFTLADRVLRAGPLRTRAFGGTWTVTGSVPLERAAAWTATVDAEQIDLDGVLAALRDGDADGPSSRGGVADIEATVNGGVETVATGRGTMRLRSGTFVLNDLRATAPAQLTAAFSVRGGTLSLQNANAQVARAEYGPLRAESASARFNLAGDRLTFSDLRFTSCGGSWTHNGSYLLRDGGAFGGQATIDGASPTALMAMFGFHDSTLDVQRLDLQGEFRGTATDAWLAHLDASGSLLASGGSVQRSGVLTALWDALIRRQRAAAPAVGHNRLDQFRSDFTLAAGQLRTQDLALKTQDYSITGAGTVGIDGRVDLTTRIILTASGVQRMVTLGSLPLPTKALPTLPPIPARVGGTLTNLSIRPDVSAVPLATVGWLVDSVVSTPAALGGAVIKGVGGLFRGAERAVGIPPAPAPTPGN